MVNYVRIAATAKRLIEENGRDVTLIKKTRAPADSAAPWRGPTSPGNTTVDTIKAVIYPKEEKNSEGELVYMGYEVAMLAHDSLAAPSDLTTLDAVVDEGLTYKVTKASKIGPGDTVITYELHLKR
jgi:hypothetical protein